MELNRIIMTVCLGGVLLVVAYVLAFRRRAAEQDGEEEDDEQKEEEEQEKRQERWEQGEQNERPQQKLGNDPPHQKPGSEESGKGSAPEANYKLPVADVLTGQKESLDSSFLSQQEYESLMTRTQSSDILSQRVHDLKNHLVLLRKYVCRQAYGKGRALLEALGLTKAQIAKYYGMYPLNEEEAVQDGLQAWIGGSLESSWSDLLEAMETAGIDIQQREGLKEELCGNAGGVQVVKAKARAGPTVVSESTVERTSVLHDIKAEYVKIKGVFVEECEAQGTPTLEEVKDHCIDLIEGVLTNMPQVMRHKYDIEQAKTLSELARVVCFRLSTWISYDFFKKVIAQFQPALKTVEEQLQCYEDELKHLLQEKLVNIAELQQREEEYEVPSNMAEFAVEYDFDADGICVTELIAKKDFLALSLGIPKHSLQVLSWRRGSVITYRVLRDMLPLAELAMYRENTQRDLIQHGVKNVYFAEHLSQQPNLVDQSPQTVHLQRRAIVTVLDEHRQDLDVTSLTSDLKDMGVMTAEQCQKLASLDDMERRHEALLYTLLAQDGSGTYNKLVECMGSRDVSIVEDLQATFNDVKTLPGALSVIPSSPVLVKPTRDWKNLGPCLKVIQHIKEGGMYDQMAVNNSEGLLAVTDNTNNRVHLLTKEGALVRSIGEGMFRGYFCVAAFDLKGNIWVIEQARGQYMNNKILKLSQDGRLLQDICQLVKDGHFQSPCGMSVSPDGLIYICDRGNHRVTVHDEEGKYQFAFGSFGSGPGCFGVPRDITFGSDDLVYVTDVGNKRVCVWSMAGTYKRDYKTKYYPTLIAATNDNHLVITSFLSDTVMVYTLDGQLVHEFGGKGSDLGKFNGPSGICVDNDGLVYVADRSNQRVQVF